MLIWFFNAASTPKVVALGLKSKGMGPFLRL